MKYFLDKAKGRYLVTKVEGVCGCGGGGNLLTETYATAAVNYTYNPFGQVWTRTDQLGGVTTNTYAAL